MIKQTKIDTFEIEYVSDVELTETQIKNIKKEISIYLEPNLQFHFTKKPFLERTNSGKLKQFISSL